MGALPMFDGWRAEQDRPRGEGRRLARHSILSTTGVPERVSDCESGEYHVQANW
jgi:hypothetical protein